MSEQRNVRIEVPVLARVEGEGALSVNVVDGRIDELELRIFEPPRLFEKFLEQRSYQELPDIVARICGICPVAYQMSAVQAIEQAFGIQVSPWMAAMRRVMYCGEWIQSHSLHIHLLAAPDFFGYENAIAMAGDDPEPLRRGLRLQALGNELMSLFGGRSVHPVGVCAGGFHHAPEPTAVQAMQEKLAAALDDTEALVHWSAALDLPRDDQQFTCVALRHPDEYPMYEGRLTSSAGLDAPIDAFPEHFTESQVPHSTALHAHHTGRPYLVGPLARLNLNLDKLPPAIHQLLAELPVRFPSTNMYHSIVARAVEIHFAVSRAVELLEDYAPPEYARMEEKPVPAMGTGCSEAPRGLLWHRYGFDQNGLVKSARIVPPTSQNQARIEQDLHASLTAFGLGHDDAALRLRAESVIRNYDPCISCSTHFLDLQVTRS
ncbi:MAG: Ni/Fe hydrogenase subunit alpha [Pseudomonadota bacterium]|nr:MAG: Ni/Fe hydrogenase subunit alpha [Pseudomonadota bacterium]